MLKVWPELVPEQLSLLPLLSCGGPGGQVRMPLGAESGGVWCPSGGDDSCCHANGVLLNSCEGVRCTMLNTRLIVNNPLNEVTFLALACGVC